MRSILNALLGNHKEKPDLIGPVAELREGKKEITAFAEGLLNSLGMKSRINQNDDVTNRREQQMNCQVQAWREALNELYKQRTQYIPTKIETPDQTQRILKITTSGGQ